MDKCLYFICPTDHLEPLIENKFPGENYYYSSLGNSINFDQENIWELNALIEFNRLNKIIFVLSDHNKFILDAMQDKDFSCLRGMERFYDNISIQKSLCEIIWSKDDLCIPIISHHLEMKMNELLPQVSNWLLNKIEIDAKIYDSKNDTFKEMHFNLFREENLNLN